MSENASRHNIAEAGKMTPEEAVARAAEGCPVLIAGPTASGKSALALAIAETSGGVVVNADALQVYAPWPILTAQPTEADRARAPHALYGHVPAACAYSVGHWLRDLAPLLGSGPRPIVVGGTGLYLTALTEGLAEIPPVPPSIRAAADGRERAAMLAELDPRTRARIDPLNRARVQRAWEVAEATVRPLADWQDDPAPPLLPRAEALALVVDSPPETLTPRMERRFDAMLAHGALAEARRNLSCYDPARPAHRAIGAAELTAHLRGEIDLAAARDRAVIATRRYAKRQRTWFRARMDGWTTIRRAES
jgi:tRNA dimethylallyltransferase